MVYQKLVKRWRDQLSEQQFHTLREFSRHMDRNSLNLVRMEMDPQPTAYYTNEAEWFRFSLGTMETLLNKLKAGTSWSWEQLAEDHRLPTRPDFTSMR